MVETFKSYPQKTICPKCGEAQVFKWDSVDDGRNIILTSLHDHGKKVQKKQLKEVA